MRHSFLISVLALALVPATFAQQQQQPSSDPHAPPPPPPQAPSTQPDKSCGGQAQRGAKGPWKASSNCSPPEKSTDTPAIQTAPGADQQPPKRSTADDNPFPEDVSRKAEDAVKAKEAEDAKPAPTSSAPGADESSSRDKLDKVDLLGDKDSNISDGAGGVVHNPKLAADDVHVGQFYLNREDYKGAYVRFKEASQVDPENADAVFYLAETARRMNHRDEAAQNYQLYLDALPDGPKAKEARKALRELSASAKH